MQCKRRRKLDTDWTLLDDKIVKQREIKAFDRQGTQQQRPESPTVTPTLLLCPLSVERYYFPLFVDSTQAL